VTARLAKLAAIIGLRRHAAPPSFANADPAAAHQAHLAAVLDARAEDATTLDVAADELDALWVLDEARGARDGLGGCEYQRLSLAPRLRSMAAKINPPGEVDPERAYSGVRAAERAAA
jgi:hypothetical protein